jgi:hypothetical protein
MERYNICAIPKVTPCSAVENLRPISLTSVLSKIQESYAIEWINQDVGANVNECQYGGLPGSSAVLALVNLIHKWYLAMETPGRVIRIIFLDFRKAYDLVDHNKLLENCEKIGVRPALISWLGSYLKDRSQVTKFRNEFSQEARVKGGVPQGSKIGPIAFTIHINDLPLIISPINPEDEDISLFMDDTTLSEVIDITQHVSNCPIRNSQRNVDNILQFTRNQNMELNSKKCKEMLVDFRKVKTIIPSIAIGGDIFTRVKSFKLLGVWIDEYLKWNTNTAYQTNISLT